ncbi:dihydrofolate reductase [Idiomarina fontislapidosi]|mgnify:CR=1 FL=1|uniref:Dihydrofolate reductase n=1 Tax=Idiomarina fontislapidosi TaxID=263723 RepID=A0A432Y2A3_9GAMM|nr:type 3 dihydrofolate reductase [Idiomarina fontislapidosi]PYE33237.1 dihydrofolate reductase [Idiomarina fontislapidosi]RUO55078.1 type 3 dihydrofolate reductase [Idiomarina fontislapidosi]
MKISLVAAMAKNRVIGRDNTMPWHIPSELKYFKKITLGKPIVMGRRTFESLGRPLPGRQNIVLSTDPNQHKSPDDGVVWVSSVSAAIDAAGDVDELMVIGGGKIYQLFFPFCHRLYVTDIELDVEGDTYFPDYRKSHDWHEVTRQHVAADNAQTPAYTTRILDRKS